MRLGIIHRDVKLANLFLTRTASGWPLVKVLDFGVSKTIANAEAQADVTKTAAMLGSPKYMSPEQMNDARLVDARTDVWSLGVVLYRLVTGKAPFEGDTIGRLCMAVLSHEPPPVNVIRPDAPPVFAAVVARCLEKDRSRRFANVAELAAAIAPYCAAPERAQSAIGRIASVLGVPAPPMGWMASLPPPAPMTPRGIEGTNPAWSAPNDNVAKGRPELVLAAAIAALVAALIAVGFVMLREPPKRGPVAATTVPPPLPPTTVETAPVAPPPPVVIAPQPVATEAPAGASTSTKAGGGKKTKTGGRPAGNTSGELFPGDRK